MTDYRVWGTVNQMGPEEFAVIVSGVSIEEPGRDTQVSQAMCRSLEEATLRQRELMQELGRGIVDRGDRVVDVEI